MPSGGSARRYAQAVFDIAKEQDTLDQWRDNLQTLADVLGLPDAQAFMESPRVSEENKHQLLDQHLGSVAPLARNLAMILIRRNRSHLAQGILDGYLEMLDEERGIVAANVTSAEPMDDDLQEQVRRLLNRQAGRELRLSVDVDPDIIGGFVARVGDRVLDGSTRSRLRNLREWLRESAASS